MIERILELMEERGVKAATLLNEIELSHSSINEWKKGKAQPSGGAIVKLAKYFNVSTDYLLGITDNKEPIYISSKKDKNETNNNDDTEYLKRQLAIAQAENIAKDAENTILKAVILKGNMDKVKEESELESLKESVLQSLGLPTLNSEFVQA